MQSRGEIDKQGSCSFSQDDLHFIWFGSNLVNEFIVPGESKAGGNVARLLECARDNPDRTIHLWTDEPSLSSLKKERMPDNVKLWNFNQHFKDGDKANKTRLETIDFLCRPLTPPERTSNYGAASDLARAMILSKYGGIYLDFDTQLKKPLVSLQKLREQNPKRGEILLSYESRKNYAQFPFPLKLCNDLLCCPAEASFPERYLQEYLHYLTEQPQALYNLVILAKTEEERKTRKNTTETLGPKLWRYLVLKKLVEQMKLPCEIEYSGKKLRVTQDEDHGQLLAHKLSQEKDSPESEVDSEPRVILPSNFSQYCEMSFQEIMAMSNIYAQLIDESSVIYPVEYYQRGIDNSWIGSVFSGSGDTKFLDAFLHSDNS